VVHMQDGTAGSKIHNICLILLCLSQKSVIVLRFLFVIRCTVRIRSSSWPSSYFRIRQTRQNTELEVLLQPISAVLSFTFLLSYFFKKKKTYHTYIPFLDLSILLP
jgi:hypothetical protein